MTNNAVSVGYKPFMRGHIFLKNALLDEFALQKEKMFLWMPFFLGIGIGLYFVLPQEPDFLFGGILAVFLVSLLPLVYAHLAVRNFLIFSIMVALGFVMAQIRANYSYTPLLQKEIGPVEVQGKIELIEDKEEGKGVRLVLSKVVIEDMAPKDTPRKIRVSLRKEMERLQAGQTIKMLAGLNPPSPPLMPGGFDFQRYMYFQQIGALGFAYKPPEMLEKNPSVLSFDLIERLRRMIDIRIEKSLSYPDAGIAMALVTGRRAGISDDDNTAINKAGLTHLLSISGLHIGLFSGIVFFVSRLLMACIPGLALYYPIKKYAAVLAFGGALFYTFLAGSSIPAERSLIMVGLALLAIVLDRSPFSLRLVAVAALVVLFFVPESLLSASFQMSFGAVAALVVVFEWLTPKMLVWYRHAGAFRKVSLYFMSVCLTTIIATVATAPFTIFHFQQLTLYGVVANAIAVPLTAFIIMPAAMLSLFCMPFGLEYWPLQIMGVGIQAIVDVSYAIAAWPHAVLRFSVLPMAAMAYMVSGILFFLIWNGRLRFLGFVPFAVSIFLILSSSPPDILIAPRFDLAGYRTEDGFYVSTKRREKFVRESWERSLGYEEGATKVWPNEGSVGSMACDKAACRLEMKGQKISFLQNPSAFSEKCLWANVILSFDPVGKQRCSRAPVIDKFDAIRNGAYAVWLSPQDALVRNTQEFRGERLWSRSSGRSAKD